LRSFQNTRSAMARRIRFSGSKSEFIRVQMPALPKSPYRNLKAAIKG
jgi:hypothetical protein